MVSISLDISFLVQMANVLLLMVFLNLFLFKPLREILGERAALFARLKSKADAAKSEIENGEMEKARLNAESLRQALSLKSDLAGQGREKERSLLAEAQEKAALQINESRARLRQSAAAARTALMAETKNLARDMAEKILGRPL